MAWDQAFNLTWAQRIDKEERAFLYADPAGQAAQGLKTAGGGGRRSTRAASSCASRSVASRSMASSSMPPSPVLSHAGSRAARQLLQASQPHGHGSQSSVPSDASSRGRAQTDGMRRRAASTPSLPDSLHGITRFPVQEKDIVTARAEPTADGKVAAISFRPEEVQAMWWPNKGSYTRYHAQFTLTEPPGWTPKDILRSTQPRT